MKTFFIFTILFIELTISSCYMGDEEDLPPAYIQDEIVPYEFKTGSYWIYENDSTSVLDSVIVSSTENGFYWLPLPSHGEGGTKHEYYKINLKSFATSQTYNDYLTNYYIIRNGNEESEEAGQTIFSSFSDTGDSWHPAGMKIIAKFSTMTINDNIFNNVIETKITASEQKNQEFAYDTYLYFTNTIGLIKKVTDLGNGSFESWSIKRWSVIK